jgi:hypothetical protein
VGTVLRQKYPRHCGFVEPDGGVVGAEGGVFPVAGGVDDGTAVTAVGLAAAAAAAASSCCFFCFLVSFLFTKFG